MTISTLANHQWLSNALFTLWALCFQQDIAELGNGMIKVCSRKNSKQSTWRNPVSRDCCRGKLEARESLGSTWQRGSSFPSLEGENIVWWLLARLSYLYKSHPGELWGKKSSKWSDKPPQTENAVVRFSSWFCAAEMSIQWEHPSSHRFGGKS